MALQISTIADSISKLTVTGATMKDIDEIPESPDSMDSPAIIPKPDGFLSNFRMERNSFGDGATAKMTVQYTLTYRLLHSAIGEGMSGIFGTYAAMVGIVGVFLDVLLLNDAVTGSLDSQPFSVSEFGPVQDPAGNGFHGCDIGIDITEFVN